MDINECKIVNTDYRWYLFPNTHTHTRTHTHCHSFMVFNKNSGSKRKVKIYRRILWKRLQVWIQDSHMLLPLAREFCVVNWDFSDLWCLINTLLIGNKNATWHQTINGVFSCQKLLSRQHCKNLWCHLGEGISALSQKFINILIFFSLWGLLQIT